MTEPRSNTTLALLEEVVKQLISSESNTSKFRLSSSKQVPKLVGSVYMDEEDFNLVDIVKKMSQICSHIEGDKPNMKSKLFAATHYLLTSFCGFVSEWDSDTWPCPISYSGEVISYRYLTFMIDISVMQDKHLSSNLPSFYYLCISFQIAPHVYTIIELKPERTISLEGNEDLPNIKTLCDILVLTGQNFCSKFAKCGRYKSREYSSCGISPVFSWNTAKLSKKSKTSAGPSMVSTGFQFKPKKSYIKLCETIAKLPSIANDSSRLFTLIINLLKNIHQCKIADMEEWSCNPKYDGEIIIIEFPVNSTIIPRIYQKFAISLIRNSKEFFFCIRLPEDETMKVIQKMNSDLVPKFCLSDAETDHEIISNVTRCLLGIVKNYILPVIAGLNPLMILESSESSETEAHSSESSSLVSPSTDD